jgi:hypothetical protein
MWFRTIWRTDNKYLDESVAIKFRNMERGFCTYETSVQIRTSTRRHIPENSDAIYNSESDWQRASATSHRPVLCDTLRQLRQRLATWF